MGASWFGDPPFASNLALLTMTDFPFESNIHVKRKIEPAEGFSLWFADVPEGGLAADTYLCWCVFPDIWPFWDPHAHSRFVCCSGASDERSDFYVEPHYHPKSDEHFTILEGEVRFEIDGKERIVKEGDDCVIPRGAVHSIASPKGKNVKFKVKGDHDPVAERDFLIQMFTLVESVSVNEL